MNLSISRLILLSLVREWPILTSPGLIVFFIIEWSMILLVLVSIFGRPRMLKVTVLFLGVLAGLAATFIITTYILGAILGMVMG